MATVACEFHATEDGGAAHQPTCGDCILATQRSDYSEHMEAPATDGGNGEGSKKKRARS